MTLKVTQTSSFSTHLTEELWVNKENFTDFSIKVLKQTVPCHRLILSSQSPVLKASIMTDMREAESGEIRLDQFSCKVVLLVVQYMYTGCTEFSSDQLMDAVCLSHFLELSDLHKLCTQHIPETLTPSNVITWMHVACQQNLDNVITSAKQIIAKSFNEISNEEQYLTLSLAEVRDFIKVAMENQVLTDDLLRSIIIWINHAQEQRINDLDDLIQPITLNQCSPNMMREIRQNYKNILEMNPSFYRMYFDSVFGDSKDEPTHAAKLVKPHSSSAEFSPPSALLKNRNAGSRDTGYGLTPSSVDRHDTKNHDDTLHRAENPWKPNFKVKKVADTEEAKSELLYKTVLCIMNKLTPQKFQTLVQQILDLQIDTEERLKGSIDRIFEKAIDEPNFSVAYANMCRCMTVLKVPSDKDPNEPVLFRSPLLNRCQKEFEKDRDKRKDIERREQEIEAATSEKERKKLKEEMRLRQAKDKCRTLGNIRFIGELFKLKMLTEEIMHDCLARLLKSNDEENLECLCLLMTTIGKDIDHPKNKQRVEMYFQLLDRCVKSRATSSRVRFMIQDLIDLRKSKWTPRRDDNKPKTIQQIHKEAHHEEQQKAVLLSRLQQEQKHLTQGGRGGGGIRQQQQTVQVGGYGRHSVGGGKSNRIDSDKMKLTHNMETNIRLVPTGRSEALEAVTNWSVRERRREAHGGDEKTASQKQDRLSIHASNRPEREPAIDSSYNISDGGQQQGENESTANRRGQNHSNQPLRRQTSCRLSSTAAAAAPRMGLHDLECKTKSILDAYLHIHDLQKAITSIKEFDLARLHMFVYQALNHVFEKTKHERQMTGTLLHDLVKNSVITVEQYLQGLHEILEFAEDMEIDIPKVWTYLGEMISPMVQDGSVPLNFLRGACKPVNPQKAGKLLAEVLHDAAQRLGHLVVGEQWRQSGLSWEEFLDPSKNLDEFIRQNKLEFTVGTEEPISPIGKGLSPDQIQQELNQRVVKKKVENSDIIDWIMANVGEANTKDPAFIRALTTAVCSSAIGQSNPQVDLEFLKGRLDLLRHYLDHNEQLELQALYALQALVHKLEHPPVVLRAFFDTLYDEEVIALDAFKSWDSSTVEMAGKGVARSSVEQFFIWLENAEEDTADN